MKNTLHHLILIAIQLIVAFPLCYSQYAGGCGNSSSIGVKYNTCLDSCCLPTLPVINTNATKTCGQSSVILKLSNGVLNDAKYWQWYTLGCGVNAIGTGNEITVTPTATTTYYVRAEGGCVTNGKCASITITVDQPTYSLTTLKRCKSYYWNGKTYTTSGIYVWKGINAAGCDSTATLDLTIINEVVNASVSATNAYCFGSASGSITVSPVNGLAPYLYKLGTVGNPVSSNTFTQLKAGKYFVTITDARGCTGTTNQITITQRPEITGNVSVTHVDCYGKNSGLITINASNGLAPYLYRKGTTGAFTTTNTFSNLYAGFHRIYIQDAAGCSSSVVTEILQTAQIDLTGSITPVQCFGTTSGKLIVNGSGGTPPYYYMIGNTGSYSTINFFNNLAAGTYVVNIKDAKNCFYQKNMNVVQPSVLQATVKKNDANCNNTNDGSIMIQVSGGVPPYKYKLGLGSSYSSLQYFNNLSPGNYSIYYADSNNCVGSISCTINAASNCITSSNKNKSVLPKVENGFSIKISPNPWKSNLQITTYSINTRNVNFRIWDMHGKIVYNITCKPNTSHIFKQDAAPGVYLIEAIQDNIRQTYTILKH